jgi:rhodanese-related sulfurtransferase
MDYKGDVTPRQAYDALTSGRETLLIDVRTPAEWTYVGTPMMPNMIQASWPPPENNPDFVAFIEHIGVPKDIEIYLICRSGYRSAKAAGELAAAGYDKCYNVAEGFEGDRDNNGHRGKIGGWKVAGLPWQQG